MSFRVRFTGLLSELADVDRRSILVRAREATDEVVSERVRAILARVRTSGDAALKELTHELDAIEDAEIEVPGELLDRALSALAAPVVGALEHAVKNLERVHRAMLPLPVEVESEPGVWVGRRAEPLAAVGVYAPGGRAAYPSSVLMGVVPARVAGVKEIVVCTPPSRGGSPSDVVLAAAAIAGATKVFALGGAQAIAALAFGTKTVPKVDRIVGPGNAYVAEAKRQVAGFVGIDAPAGPSEILIIADESASAEHLARELIAQAEHDPEASCVALVTSDALVQQVVSALASMSSPKAEIVAEALSSRGAVLSIRDLEEAYGFAAEYAAEHLLLAVRDPQGSFPKIRHAGTVFFGPGASVAFGDYMTGANHVLPTAGSARSFSGLSTLDFIRWTTYQHVTASGAARMAGDVGILADAEGLPAHAAAARAFDTPTKTAPFAPPAARASYRQMKLYSSNRRPAAVDLSDNTNQLGPPPSAVAMIDPTRADTLSRYPSHYADGLKAAIAARIGVGADEIVTGCGSDDVLDSAIRAFASPGDRLAFPTPTFAMLPFFCAMNDLEACAIPLLGEAHHYDIDAEALLASDPRILYVCSPNNPTGTLASKHSIERILAEARGLVILDEAYVEYAAESLVRRAKASGRLLVVRTLSKAYGLAGARVGYGVGAPELVAEVEKSRGPYKITHLAEAMAEAVMRRDGPWVDEGVRNVLRSRKRFEAWLGEHGIAYLPSAANFVLVRVADAVGQADRLREKGIAVRPFPALPGLGDCLRISVGPWPILDRILPELEQVLG